MTEATIERENCNIKVWYDFLLEGTKVNDHPNSHGNITPGNVPIV